MKTTTMKTKPETYTSPLIDDIFASISDEEMEMAEKRVMLAVKIDETMRLRGIKKVELARILGKQPSEISKWLSGTHNFQIDTLFKLEKVLKISLINIAEKQDNAQSKVYVCLKSDFHIEDIPNDVYKNSIPLETNDSQGKCIYAQA